MVESAEDDGADADFGGSIADFEVEDEIFAGYGVDTGLELRVFGAR